MKITLNIEPQKIKKIIKIDQTLLNKYSHLSGLENKFSRQKNAEEHEIEYFELFDKDLKRVVTIFDVMNFTDDERRKFDTLFYMVYKYRTGDFRYRVARHESELSFGLRKELTEEYLSEQAKTRLTDLIALLRMRDNDYNNVSIIFKVNDIETSKKTKSPYKNKRVEFKGDICPKYITHRTIDHLLDLLSFSNNNYLDSFFYFCRDVNNITVEEVQAEIDKIFTKKKGRSRKEINYEQSRYRIYKSFMINLIQRFVFDEELTLKGKKMNLTQLRHLCYLLLASFGFISEDKINNNRIDLKSEKVNNEQIVDFIRKLTDTAITDVGKVQIIEPWDILNFLNTEPNSNDVFNRYPDFVNNFNKFNEIVHSSLRASLNDDKEIVIKKG